VTSLERWRQLMRWWIRTHDVSALAEGLSRMSEGDRAAALEEINEDGSEVLSRDLGELLRRHDRQLVLF